MDLTKPYDKSYSVPDILKGLKFYYELLDKTNIKIYLKPNFPIKRRDIELVLNFLYRIPDTSEINNLYFSHPELTSGIESIDFYNNLSFDKLSHNEFFITIYLEHFLFTGINAMLFKAKIDIPKAIHNLSISDKIKYLIENKYYYKQNQDSFPERFIKETVEYCDSLIEKNKEIQRAEESNAINDEVKRMIESYYSLIDNSIKNNDLISPLIEKRFDVFISKLKAMLFIPSFYDINTDDKERIFHVYLLALLQGRIEGYRVSSNKESGIGRYDIALFPIENINPGVIIEIKKIGALANTENELDNALQQIKNKSYNIEFKNLGVKNILSIGVVFKGLEPHIKFETE